MRSGSKRGREEGLGFRRRERRYFQSRYQWRSRVRSEEVGGIENGKKKELQQQRVHEILSPSKLNIFIGRKELSRRRPEREASPVGFKT